MFKFIVLEVLTAIAFLAMVIGGVVLMWGCV